MPRALQQYQHRASAGSGAAALVEDGASRTPNGHACSEGNAQSRHHDSSAAHVKISRPSDAVSPVYYISAQQPSADAGANASYDHDKAAGSDTWPRSGDWWRRRPWLQVRPHASC